jgi:hypothetical protein
MTALFWIVNELGIALAYALFCGKLFLRKK